MSEPAVIRATFSDLKLIRGRKVCQLVFEIPVEHIQAATDALGFPNSEPWCAIARLNQTSAPHSTPGPERAGDRALDAAPAQPTQKPNSTRAVMMAKDEEFLDFLRTLNYEPSDEAEAECCIEDFCGVTSKADLNVGKAGAKNFELLREKFYAWRREQRQ